MADTAAVMAGATGALGIIILRWIWAGEEQMTQTQDDDGGYDSVVDAVNDTPNPNGQIKTYNSLTGCTVGYQKVYIDGIPVCQEILESGASNPQQWPEANTHVDNNRWMDMEPWQRHL
jgi:hypothetical protein